jgi:hypothetical protein
MLERKVVPLPGHAPWSCESIEALMVVQLPGMVLGLRLDGSKDDRGKEIQGIEITTSFVLLLNISIIITPFIIVRFFAFQIFFSC